MANVKYKVGTKNVFVDLGVPQPEEALAKADLARGVIAAIKRRKLTQVAAALVLHIPQPKVSDLMRGRLSGFSMERPMKFLVLLGKDVEVVVKEPVRGAAKLRVSGTLPEVVLKKAPKNLKLRKWKGRSKASFAKLGYSSVDKFIDDVRGR